MLERTLELGLEVRAEATDAVDIHPSAHPGPGEAFFSAACGVSVLIPVRPGSLHSLPLSAASSGVPDALSCSLPGRAQW